MTLLELLTSSLRSIGVKNPGVTLTAEEVNDAKEILNLLLDELSVVVGIIYAATIEGLTLTIGAASRTIGIGQSPPIAPTANLSATAGIVTSGNHYVKLTTVTAIGETTLGTATAVVNADGSHKIDVSVIPPIGGEIIGYNVYMTKAGGTTYYFVALVASTTYAINVADVSLTVVAPTTNTTGGNFNTVRPTQILNAFVRDSGGTDHDVAIIGPGKYQGISTKTTAGRPYFLHFVGTAPLGTIYLYPVPDAAETLYLDSLKPLTELTTLTATIALPPGYMAMLKSNLAVALAPEYNREPSKLVFQEAHDTKKAIIAINAASRHEPVNLRYGHNPGYPRSILEG